MTNEANELYYDAALNAWASTSARVSHTFNRGLLLAVEAAGFSLGIEGRLRAMVLLTELEASGQATSSRILCDHIAPLIVRDPDGRVRLQKVVDHWWRSSVDRPETFTPVHPLRSLMNRFFRSPIRRWFIVSQIFGTALIALIVAAPIVRQLWERVNAPTATGAIDRANAFGNAQPDRVPLVADVLAPEYQIPLITGAAAVALFVVMWLAFVAWRRAGLRRGRLQDLTRRTELHLDAVPGPAEAKQLNGLLEIFREPVEGHRRLDVQASVEASSRAAGFFTLADKAARTLPSYTLLIDRRSGADHAAHWAEAVGNALVRAGVEVRSYLFEAAPDRIRDIRGGRAIPINSLKPGEGERLILFGDSVDLSSTLALPWFNGLTRWGRPAFLDLALDAPMGAGRAGALEQFGFVRNAFDGAGLVAIGHHLRGSPVRHASTRGDRAHEYPLLFGDRDKLLTETPLNGDELEALDCELAAWLGPNVYRWLCACAVYPTLHPRLTASLGRVLRDHLGQPVDSLLAAGRLRGLPWMRVGDMPDWLRIRLMGQLGAIDGGIVREHLRVLMSTMKHAKSRSSSARVLFGAASRGGSTSDRPFVEFMTRRVERADRPTMAATRALRTLLAPDWFDRSGSRFWLIAFGAISLVGLIGIFVGRAWTVQLATAPRLMFIALLLGSAIGIIAYTAGLLAALYAWSVEIERALQKLIDELLSTAARPRNRARLPRWASDLLWIVDAAFGRAVRQGRAEEDVRVRIFVLICLFASVFICLAIGATWRALLS